MKKVITFCIIIAAISVINIGWAQSCIPDHIGYTTVPDSGILLPKPLPHAAVGYPYVQVLTIGIPSTAQGFSVNWVQFNHIISFLTPVNPWTVVSEDGSSAFPQWNNLTWHCVTLSGTPVTPGVDSIVIYVNVNVDLGFPYTQSNTKGFTIPLIVDDVTNIDKKAELTTQLIEGHPNPFNDHTQIGIIGERTGKATLYIYS